MIFRKRVLPDFDEIRPYRDDEIPAMMTRLLDDPAFIRMLRNTFRDETQFNEILRAIRATESVESFQLSFMVPFFNNIIAKSSRGVFIGGLENLKKNGSYLFISNHRDIILDSALLNVQMYKYGYNPTEIAMGSNLLIHEWIETLSRVNRSFIVKRNIPVKQMLESSKLLSEYIRTCIKRNGDSIWIAQREGRAKDGFDQTQPSLLKMLNMSNKRGFFKGFMELRIVPMAISYEIEPCGNEKVAELLKRQSDQDYQKSESDDMKSMASGLRNQKGRIQIQFAPPIDRSVLKEIAREENRNERLKKLADYIDQQIYRNYYLYPNNYIAYDEYFKTGKYAGHYSPRDKEKFLELTHERLKLVNEDREEAMQLWLKMYATPVVNFEACEAQQ
jgi:1-acyl-sn-glycerol-3-phosphate acyltransferase